MKSSVLIFSFLAFVSGCAQLYKVQIGNTMPMHKGKRFEVKVSETAIDLDEAKQLTRSLSKSKRNDHFFDTIAMFQIGPRTGVPVFNEKYARNIRNLIFKKCPSGKIANLTSIREARKYPVISGEIVKITGYCYK